MKARFLLAALGLSFSVASAQTAAERSLLTQLNAVRAAGVTCPGSGRRPPAAALAPSEAHARAAGIQAAYMARTGRISHTGENGSTPRIRAASTGVSATSVTEIIYMGAGLNPAAAMAWWRQSPVHCYWMTEGRYTRAGVRIVPGARGTAYVIVLSSGQR